MAQRKVLITVELDDNQAEAKVKKMVNVFDELDKGATKAGQSGDRLMNAFLQADLAGRAIAFLTSEVKQIVGEYLKFNRELANLNTLLDDGSNINRFRAGLLDLDPALGQTSELARGMYQAISSGVDAGDALQFIEVSAKAARAGLATTFETVDAGTSVMNSFKLEAKDASMVYDKMFEVVKRGKIEMPQLAQSIGQVSNIAAQTGVTLDEMFAVIATASTTIRPTQAIEGFRTLLANIIKPSEQALEVAQRLNIEFGEKALRSKGLAAFLNDITTAANGNKEVLARLFGDVQALNVVMAVTGNRADNLAKDLKGIAAASGTVEEAFQKQKQSTDAQLSALKVSFQQFLMKTFMLVEPLLTGILSLVNKYPAVFGAAAVAIGGLATTQMLWNSQLLISASVYIPQLLANLRNLITVMFAFNQVTSLSAAGLVSFAAGWIGIALAIGILIYALANYDTAAEKANKITQETIQTEIQAFQSAQALATAAKDVAAAQSGSAERHAKLNEVLGQLDPKTAAYIQALRDEEQQVKVVNAELEKNVALKRIGLQAELRVVAKGIKEQLADVNKMEGLIQGLNKDIEYNQRIIDQGGGLFGKSSRQGEIDVFSNDIVTLNNSIRDTNKELTANETKLLSLAQALGFNDAQFKALAQSAGYVGPQLQAMEARYAQLTGKIESTNEALQQQVLDLDSVRHALQALKNTGDLEIETQVLNIVKTAKSAAEARKMAQDALKGDDKFRALVEQRKAYNAAEKAARDVFEPSQKTGHGGRGVVESTTNDVRKLRAEVEALQRNGGVLYKLKIDKSDLEQTKSDLENILKLRHQLTLPLTKPLPKDLAGIREETRVLNEQKKIVDAVTEAKHAQSTAEFELAQLIIMSTLPLVDAENRAQKKYTQALIERKNAELDLTAELNAAVRLRREALKAEQDTLRDTRQQYTQLRLEAVKAAEEARLADIRSQLEFAVAFGQEPELQKKLQIELNKETDQIKPPLVEMNGNVKRIVYQLTSILGALSGKSGGTTAAGAQDLSLDKAIALGKARGFDVITTTGGRHNAGSLHYLGQAVDFRTRGHSAADIEAAMESLRAEGYTVLDERTRPRGQKVWGGPHFHVEFGAQSGRRVETASPPTIDPDDDVLRSAAYAAGVNLADLEQTTRLYQEYTQQRNAIIDLNKAQQDLNNTREIDAALRKKLLDGTGQTLEQFSIEAALKNRERDRIKEDLATATAAGVVQHDLAEARVRDAQYVARVTVEAERARAAAAKSTQDQIISDEAYLFQLQSGNAEALRQLYERAQADRVQGHISLYGEIAKIEDQIAHAGEDAAMRHRLAWLQSVRGVQEESEKAAITQIQAQVRLADATIYHADQANARVMDFLASQKSVTESIADFKVGVIKGGFDAIDSGFQKLIGSGNVLKKLLADLLANLTKLALSKFLTPLFGGGQSSGGAGGGGFLAQLLGMFRPAAGGAGSGTFSALTPGFAGGPGGAQFLGMGGGGTGPDAAQARALGSLFQVANPFGGFGGGATLAPPVSLTEQQNNRTQLQQLISQTQASTVSGATAGNGFSLAGMASAAPFLGATLGASFGASLGKGNPLASIMGAAGMGAIGLVGGTALPAILTGSFAGLTALGFATLGIGAALAIGALIIGKNAARRRDEKTRDSAMVTALKQLDDIVKAVGLSPGAPGFMDGGAALAAAMLVRSEYETTVKGLKDKKTRDIALKDISRLDLKIAQISGQAMLQLERQKIDEGYVPEFAAGGFTPGTLSLIKVRPGELFLPPDAQLQLARNGGFIPGRDTGRDNTFMLAPANSLVLPQQKAPSIKMPSLSSSGISSTGIGAGLRASGEQQPTISIGELTIQADKVSVDQDAGRVTITGLRTPGGKNQFARTFRELRDDGSLG